MRYLLACNGQPPPLRAPPEQSKGAADKQEGQRLAYTVDVGEGRQHCRKVVFRKHGAW